MTAKKRNARFTLAAGEVFIASDGKHTPTIVIAPSQDRAKKACETQNARSAPGATIDPLTEATKYRLSINFRLIEILSDGKTRNSAVVPEDLLRQIQGAPARPEDGRIVIGAAPQTADAT